MPNIYTRFFADDEKIENIESWRLSREAGRYKRNGEVKNLMRAMEKYAGLIKKTNNQDLVSKYKLNDSGIDAHGLENIAQAIFNTEITLAEEKQQSGNFLEQVYLKALDAVEGKKLTAVPNIPPRKAHEILEEVFMFVSDAKGGFDGFFRYAPDLENPNKENLLLPEVAEILDLTLQHGVIMGVVFSSKVVEYALANRVSIRAPVVEAKAEKKPGLGFATPKFTPLADNSLQTTKEDLELEEEVASLFIKTDKQDKDQSLLSNKNMY